MLCQVARKRIINGVVREVDPVYVMNVKVICRVHEYVEYTTEKLENKRLLMRIAPHIHTLSSATTLRKYPHKGGFSSRFELRMVLCHPFPERPTAKNM